MKRDNSIYLDYQASTPVDPHVRAAMQECGERFFANPHSTHHRFGKQAADAVMTARHDIEASLGAANEEVVFTSGATEANNQAIASVLFANNDRHRNRILISAIEHKCIKNAAHFYANRLGYVVEEIPVLATGIIDIEAYQSLLSDDVLLVCVMAVNNEIGVIQDIKSLTQQAKQFGAFFHCDAAQAPEALDIDVKDWQVDMLSLSGHKIYGPKGVGVLYITNALQARLPPLIHGGGQQSGLRSGTVPTELCVGMASAMTLSQSQASESRGKLAALKKRFIDELAETNIMFRLNGDQTACHPGNINIELTGHDASALLTAMQPEICASTGSACNSEMLLPSHVLKAIGLTDEQATSSIRFSLGRYSDEQQVSDTIKALTQHLHVNA